MSFWKYNTHDFVQLFILQVIVLGKVYMSNIHPGYDTNSAQNYINTASYKLATSFT